MKIVDSTKDLIRTQDRKLYNKVNLVQDDTQI